MTHDATGPIPVWPLYRLTAADDGQVTITGPAAPPGPYRTRGAAIEAVSRLAARLTPPRTVRAEALEPDGTLWPLYVDPDGTGREAGPARPPKGTRRKKTKTPKRPRTPELEPASAPPQPAAAPPFRPPAPVPDRSTTQLRATDKSTTQLRVNEEPTAQLRRSSPPPAPAPAPVIVQNEPTTQVRRTRPPLVQEQHERPADRPQLQHVPPPAPPRRIAPPPAADPRAQAPAAAPADGPRSVPTVLRIRTLAEAGRLPDAVRMAVALDDAVGRAHGPSHPSSLEARAVRAHVTAEAGDLLAAVALYRDVAERWALQGAQVAAEQTADSAHALWLRITDPDQAIAAGTAVVRMRTQIPGADGTSYHHAVQRLERLTPRSSGAHEVF
ncbi:hypothetical protein ACFPK5_00280 [Streptomyces beijiangensis]|uniref:hypothetical protein n=1 Tax=Streptomyces beijiangensis TaxID=163361 RepID=UPI0031E46006